MLALDIIHVANGQEVCTLWQYWLLSFQTGGIKLETFLPKNQHIQRQLLNFEFWINGDSYVKKD